jgi:hypothetical protein
MERGHPVRLSAKREPAFVLMEAERVAHAGGQGRPRSNFKMLTRGLLTHPGRC